MARYFLHLRDGSNDVLDEEGIEPEDALALRTTVMANARDVISGDIIRDGLLDLRFRIDVEDEEGELVYTLPFADAVKIISTHTR